MERMYKQMMSYDSLTGLLNMEMFKIEANKLIEWRPDNKFAIVYIEINDFERTKERSSEMADFMKKAAGVLHEETKKSGLAASIGNSSFALLLRNVPDEDLMIEKIEGCIGKMKKLWSTGICSQKLSLSTGLAIYPDSGQTIGELSRSAEIAVYSAKKTGQEMVAFSGKIQEEIIRNVQMARKLREGIDKEEFVLYYQPQFDLNTKEIAGMEALVRWIHPEEGIISPGLFIPVAEESRQIHALEKWIINRAMRQKKEFEEAGLNSFELSINLSSRTLECETAFEETERIFASHKVDFSKIVVEITETAAFSNLEMVIGRLNRLKKLGLKIALDDFGTGYSSLTHLNKLPIDIVKLDRSFVDLAPEGGKETVIIKNVISMAHELGYRVVAEGIESWKQLECLREFGCETGQGFLLYRPMPVEQVKEMLGIDKSMCFLYDNK